jgi:hypothetical protein
LLISASVEAAPVTAPPVEPVSGRLYRVATGASGLFAGRDGMLAGWGSGGWRFVAPTEGLRLTASGSGVELLFHDGIWTSGSLRTNEVLVGGVKVVGARQTGIADAAGGAVIDSELRVVVSQVLAALRAHGLIQS